MTKEEILKKHFDADEDLQLAITLNPELSRILAAMEEYREQRSKEAGQRRWEYLICYIGGASLRQLGNDGWELCAISDEKMYILKRPKIFTPEPPKD